MGLQWSCIDPFGRPPSEACDRAHGGPDPTGNSPEPVALTSWPRQWAEEAGLPALPLFCELVAFFLTPFCDASLARTLGADCATLCR